MSAISNFEQTELNSNYNQITLGQSFIDTKDDLISRTKEIGRKTLIVGKVTLFATGIAAMFPIGSVLANSTSMTYLMYRSWMGASLSSLAGRIGILAGGGTLITGLGIAAVLNDWSPNTNKIIQASDAALPAFLFGFDAFSQASPLLNVAKGVALAAIPYLWAAQHPYSEEDIAKIHENNVKGKEALSDLWSEFAGAVRADWNNQPLQPTQPSA